MAQVKIACIGECMVELSALAFDAGRAGLGVAGDTLNAAVYLHRSLPEDAAQVSYVTALGDDPISCQMVDIIAAHGIETGLIARRAGALPGIYAIDLTPQGERSFHYWRSASAARSMFADGGIALSRLTDFEVIYLSGISLAILPAADRDALIAQLAAHKAQGGQVVFDSNYRPRLWPDIATAQAAMAAIWGVCTCALPSADDEAALWDDADDAAIIARIVAAGVPEIALKRGARGPILWCDGRLIENSYPAAKTLRDTTAAGDAFNGAYLAARLAGHDPEVAARRGHDLACHVIGQPGAIVDLPPRPA
jgi:2-dehydro-3-deoxygluconokinase